MVEGGFKAFLRKGHPFGDTVDRPFVYDVLHDPDFPDPASLEELLGYIKQRNPKAPPKILTDAEYLWQRYQEVT
jgi:hypothetical protein